MSREAWKDRDMGELATSSEPTMYPLTDYPDHRETFDSFAALRTHIEALNETLNVVVAWLVSDHRDDDFRKSDEAEQPEFSLLTFEPRRSKTTQWTTRHFLRSEVEAWLSGYVRDRTMRWYGWQR